MDKLAVQRYREKRQELQVTIQQMERCLAEWRGELNVFQKNNANRYEIAKQYWDTINTLMLELLDA